MTLRIACIGGGPGGLFFSTLVKRYLPDAEVELFERNQPDDVFGFGVVFSDATLKGITETDPVLRDALAQEGKHWDSIEVHARGQRYSFTGNGMSAIHRKALLTRLQEQARDVGVQLNFGTNIASLDELAGYDVVVAADGTNSQVRSQIGEETLGHCVEEASAKFIWFGTTHIFDGLTFLHRRSEHGNFAAHAYPISDALSTFIVETDEKTWRAAGLDEFDGKLGPGESDLKTKAYLEALFAEDLHGGEVVVNNSKWANFRTRKTAQWSHNNVVLLGDAIHTAHFSVGSGTKMAMEDAIVLAMQISDHPTDLATAFRRYQKIRQPQVEKVQNAARPSLSWWEHFGRYHEALDPLQFTFHFFTRSIDRAKIGKRDPELVAAIEHWWQSQHGHPPEDTTLSLGATQFDSRLLSWNNGTITDGKTVVTPQEVAVARIEAPTEESQLTSTFSSLPTSGAVLITGGTRLTRRLVAEEARLGRGLTALLAEDEGEDAAVTAVLSGRADAVVGGVSA